MASLPVRASAQADTITLGAAISLTGKYSTNGKNTFDGYQLAVKRINEMGGVKVGGKAYRFVIKYYDDESTSARGAQLSSGSSRGTGSSSSSAPTAPGSPRRSPR